jgi:hypothetical protein
VEIVPPQPDLGNPLERESIFVSLSFKKSQETARLSTNKFIWITVNGAQCRGAIGNAEASNTEMPRLAAVVQNQRAIPFEYLVVSSMSENTGRRQNT